MSNYSRQKAPRHLSLYSQGIILCGGVLSTVGWIFLGVGMTLIWTVVLNSSVMLWFSPEVDWENGQGTVIQIETTDTEINEVEMYSVKYTYFAEGKEYSGKNYTIDDDLMEGDEIAVQFNSKNVIHSKLTNGRQKMFGGLAVFALLVPFLGIGMLYHGLKENYKILKLVKSGSFTKGEMLSKEPTGSAVSINEVRYPVYKYEFEFFAKHKKRIATCQTYKVHLVEDEVNEFILYDYDNPDISTVYDGIDNAPEFDNLGQLQQIPINKFYLLIPPVLTFLIHIPWAYFVLS